MKSNLRQGKISPPTTLSAALYRRSQLAYEAGRVEAQIEDPNRALRYRSTTEYDDWRRRARKALALYREEEKQLSEWIAVQERREYLLLKQALDLLRVLEQEVDLDPPEVEFVRKLDAYFSGCGAQNRAV